MSPSKGRPPIENPKNVRLEIRMTQDQADLLSYCAEKMDISRTDVINRGIEMVKAKLDSK
nr:MAG TPA: NikA, BACTERIAL CONJUGATION, RELAXASE, DNA [Caudoviricetes sp.]